jgi:nitrite reductase/ring-hydroxylating ferredoxin subunit
VLSQEDNELLCRVGAGSLMGDLLRQYWLPFATASELHTADCDPLRVMLLGEQLIAFRDTNNRVGLLAHNCPHRGASLFFGRNEEGGLRCVYHGWKFDAAGSCVDMPNEPAESDFRSKVRAVAYPCVEKGGLLWTYMGPRSDPPPMPDLEVLDEAGAADNILAVIRECNWVQALEGDIDTSHAGFLHWGSLRAEDMPAESWAAYALTDRHPRYEVLDTPGGTLYGTYRPARADSYYWRIAAFLLPVYVMTPTGVLGLEKRFRAWVPMDDSHTLAITVGAPGARAFGSARFCERGTGWFDRFRPEAALGNDYFIDRAAQRANAGPAGYTGIASGYMQDQMITESMGPIVDRRGERLGSSDAMIIRTRRRLLEAGRLLRASGAVPPGVDDPSVYAVRTGGVELPRTANWVEATAPLRQAHVQHPGLDRSAMGGRII